jgi:hypothetical protein
VAPARLTLRGFIVGLRYLPAAQIEAPLDPEAPPPVVEPAPAIAPAPVIDPRPAPPVAPRPVERPLDVDPPFEAPGDRAVQEPDEVVVHSRTLLAVELHVGGEFPLVYLGDVDYLEDHGVHLGIGNRIAVTGIWARVRGGRRILIGDALYFREVKLPLRDENGLWLAGDGEVNRPDVVVPVRPVVPLDPAAPGGPVVPVAPARPVTPPTDLNP